jgi:hypothetical protein
MGAAARRYEGDLAIQEGESRASAYSIGGISGLLKGLPGAFETGKSLYDKYGGNGWSGASGDSALIGGFDPEIYNLPTLA